MVTMRKRVVIDENNMITPGMLVRSQSYPRQLRQRHLGTFKVNNNEAAHKAFQVLIANMCKEANEADYVDLFQRKDASSQLQWMQEMVQKAWKALSAVGRESLGRR